jgi:LPS-assembly lipoprotein
MRLLLLCSIILLTSCGFHLRTAAPLSHEPIYIQSDDRGLRHRMSAQLKAAGFQTTDNLQVSTWQLSLSNPQQSRQLLAIDSRGRASRYDTLFALTYSLQTEREMLISPQPIEISRDFLFDSQQPQGMSITEDLLFKEMQQSLVFQIIRRLKKFKPPQKINTETDENSS